MDWPIFGGAYQILFIIIFNWLSMKPCSVVNMHDCHPVN